jgi:hypothetical protein
VDLGLYVFGLGDAESRKRTASFQRTKDRIAFEGLLRAARDEREKHPKTRNAFGEIREVVLDPGDTLYIPPFWWHHVVTLEADDDEASLSEKQKEIAVSILLASDPAADESVHPCVDDRCGTL